MGNRAGGRGRRLYRWRRAGTSVEQQRRQHDAHAAKPAVEESCFEMNIPVVTF
jgi:hypothetical protein